ncbi:phage tail spike protein [Virgibacillus proomii]|uniref:phage tail spike protein n=1 Tax=Virgibacillus proomii TaxID=84407 RepID=UPI0009869C87|nr:phage tail spike protein [Virgibacillus proomii]
MIHIIDKQSDEIVGIIPNDEFWDDNYHRSLETTAETFEFTTFADRDYSEYLTGRNKVIIPDEDNGYRELTIWQAEKVHEHSKHIVVFAKASYNDLRKAQVIKPQTLKSQSASTAAATILRGTEWSVGLVESKGTRTFHIDKHTDPYSMLKRISTEFDLELNFRVETRGNKITGRYVDLVQRIGQWRGREIEFGKDLLSIRRIEDTDNIYTALIGLGPEKDGTRLEVLVEDHDALQRWGRRDPVTGELRHIIGTYEPQTEKDELSYDRLRELTKNELEKCIDAAVKYEATFADLEHVPGMENEKVRLGDTNKIKDTAFNPPLYLEARIFEVNGPISDKSKKEAKLGDFVEYTEEEVKAIWQSLQEEIKKRISYDEMVDYTYNKLTIDNKDETVFEKGKTFAEATGIKAEENAKDFAVEQDSKIKLDVEQYADNVAKQEAQSALDQAKMYAVAKTVYDNKMQQIASDITDRAPLEYVDGKIAIVDGRLDDFNIKVDEKADKTTVYTIEQIDNRINNLVTKTQYTTDMNGVVHQLDSHGTRIGQNEEAIGLKADDTKVDNINNSLTQKIANVEVKADSVTTKVEKVEAEVEGLEVGGRNLLKDSNNFKIYNTYQSSKAEVIENVSVPEWGATDASRIKTSGGDSHVKLVVDSEYLNVEQPPKEGEKFVVSVWVKNLGDNPLVVSPNARGKRVTVFKGENKRVVIQAEGTGRAWLQIQFTTPQDASDKPLDFIAWRAQIEKGNKATDWTPAPEDTEADISNLQGRVNTAEGEIKTLAGEVTAKASQSIVDTLNRRVSTAESELKLLPGEINAKVSEDGVIGAINATPERLLIDFDRVKMTGELEARHIKSLAGLNVNDQFKVDSQGKVTIGNDKVIIDDKSIRIMRPDGAVAMQDGLMDTAFIVSGNDPHYMTAGRVKGSGVTIDAFRPGGNYYQNAAHIYGGTKGNLDGRGLDGTNEAYEDVRDNLGAVAFQKYEFKHSARYLVFRFRKYAGAKFSVHVVKGTSDKTSDRIYFEILEKDFAGIKTFVCDLGKPQFNTREVTFKIGWTHSWGSRQENIRFIMESVYLTDFV